MIVMSRDVDAMHADGSEALEGLAHCVVLTDLHKGDHITHRLLADATHKVLHGQKGCIKVAEETLNVLHGEIAGAGAVRSEEADGREVVLGHDDERVDGASSWGDELHGPSANVGGLDRVLSVREVMHVGREESDDGRLREHLHDLALRINTGNTMKVLGVKKRDKVLKSRGLEKRERERERLYQRDDKQQT